MQPYTGGCQGALSQNSGECAGAEGQPSRPRWTKAWTIADYHQAYVSGRTDPVTVARRLNENVAASERRQPPMRMLNAHDPADVLRQAQQAAAR